MLELVQSVDFNIFTLKKATKDNELITITTFLLHKHKLFQTLRINIETFMTFIAKIQSGYRDVTYHNKTHGSDVCHTVYYYLTKGGFKELAKIDDLEMAAMLIGGACHDHEHPGYNNVYLIETKDEIAVRYNDVSVLENHHVASSFALINQSKFNFLSNLDKSDYKKFR